MNWEVEVSDSVQERVDRDGYTSLSWAERLYHGVWWLLFVAYGPGFEQYFREAPQDWVEAAREGLAEIGAFEMLAALNQAAGRLPWQGETPGSEVRSNLLDAMDDDELIAIERACSHFTNQPYPDKPLNAFVQRFDTEFRGPRTELELWQSKMNRGVDTTPVYVTKKINFEQEAEKDRPYSSRSCPKCNYPTPDYRPRCKRCDFPHGRATAASGMPGT